MRSQSNWHWLLRVIAFHQKVSTKICNFRWGIVWFHACFQSRRQRKKREDEKGRERVGEGNKKKIKPMNELHAHYETKKPFEALSVRSSFMVKQEKASSLKR